MNDVTPLLTLTTTTARNVWLCDECAKGVADTVFASEERVAPVRQEAAECRS